jgi:hypothetical protein
VSLTPGGAVTISNVRADASLLAAGSAITGQVTVNSTVPVAITANPTLATVNTTLETVKGPTNTVTGVTGTYFPVNSSR